MAGNERTHCECRTSKEEIMGQNKTNSVKAKKKSTAKSKLCILVIDDSATIRRSAETMIAKEGYKVITAENGFEALSKITRYHPDIIFIDIMMPRLDGYQTCAIIKNNAEFRETPVVMLTSKDGLFDKARGRVVGSDQYLTKPFTREELLGAVKKHAVA
jgi:twitching motility two-component system response regulator PilG